MSHGLRLFGPVHLSILAAIPLLAGGLVRLARGLPDRNRLIARILGILLGLNEIIWYIWRRRVEGFRFPEGLPLELCDLTLWLTVASMLLYGAPSPQGLRAFALRPAIFEFAWLAGLGGALMAVLTPDLWAPLASYPSIYFFLAHGGVVASLLFLVWSSLARPRPGCVRRTFLLVNGYAALISIFDAVFGTNYMYLCRKPVSASLLDLFGPWPIYLIGGELATIVIFWILWAPFRWPARHGLEGQMRIQDASTR